MIEIGLELIRLIKVRGMGRNYFMACGAGL
jgi:hypothetical protein